MIKSKYITVITAALLCFAILFCIFIVYAANRSDEAKITEYQEELFDNDIVTIDIQVDDSDWQELLDNAINKEYISGNLVINDEVFSTVGIRTKGNSSLSQVTSSDSDRYSLEFKFNHYVKGQTCYGLDSLCINNLLGDTTYMKDYISYDIMKYIGVATPLTNYANVTVNGEDYGFCLLLERYNKSFLDRVYNTSSGQLYNVKNQMGQGAGDKQNDTINPQGDNKGNMGGVNSSGGGGSLTYTDDDPTSYSSIFDNAAFTISEKDEQQVITAIKNLNEGTDLEQYFDIDGLLRYFAAHTVVVNLDSYISNMQQNYYIYERNGKITILPWDYGLAFGGFQSKTASSVVNFPIDTPVSDVSMEDRPLLNVLLENEEYKAKYHEYLNEIVEGYFDSDVFTSTVWGLSAKINEYVKNDTTAFYTYDEFTASLPVFIELGTLRATSIKGQLDGTIPSTTEAQASDSSALIDSSGITLSALGTMGGGRQNDGGGQDGPSQDESGSQGNQPQDEGSGQGGGMVDREVMQQAMQIIQDTDGTIPDEVTTKLKELGLTDDQITMLSNMPSGGGAEKQGAPPGNAQRDNNFTDGSSGVSASGGNTINKEYAILLFVLLMLLVGSIFFVARRKKRC